MFATAPLKYYIFDSGNTLLWHGYSSDEKNVAKTAQGIERDRKVTVTILTRNELDSEKIEIVKTSRVRQAPIDIPGR